MERSKFIKGFTPFLSYIAILTLILASGFTLYNIYEIQKVLNSPIKSYSLDNKNLFEGLLFSQNNSLSNLIDKDNISEEQTFSIYRIKQAMTNQKELSAFDKEIDRVIIFEEDKKKIKIGPDNIFLKKTTKEKIGEIEFYTTIDEESKNTFNNIITNVLGKPKFGKTPKPYSQKKEIKQAWDLKKIDNTLHLNSITNPNLGVTLTDDSVSLQDALVSLLVHTLKTKGENNNIFIKKSSKKIQITPKNSSTGDFELEKTNKKIFIHKNDNLLQAIQTEKAMMLLAHPNVLQKGIFLILTLGIILFFLNAAKDIKKLQEEKEHNPDITLRSPISTDKFDKEVFEKNIQKLEKEIKEKGKAIEGFRKSLSQKKLEIKKLNQTLSQKNIEIDSQKSEIKTLNDEKKQLKRLQISFFRPKKALEEAAILIDELNHENNTTTKYLSNLIKDKSNNYFDDIKAKVKDLKYLKGFNFLYSISKILDDLQIDQEGKTKMNDIIEYLQFLETKYIEDLEFESLKLEENRSNKHRIGFLLKTLELNKQILNKYHNIKQQKDNTTLIQQMRESEFFIEQLYKSYKENRNKTQKPSHNTEKKAPNLYYAKELDNRYTQFFEKFEKLLYDKGANIQESKIFFFQKLLELGFFTHDYIKSQVGGKYFKANREYILSNNKTFEDVLKAYPETRIANLNPNETDIIYRTIAGYAREEKISNLNVLINGWYIPKELLYQK